jgi:hypothetical protein
MGRGRVLFHEFPVCSPLYACCVGVCVLACVGSSNACIRCGGSCKTEVVNAVSNNNSLVVEACLPRRCVTTAFVSFVSRPLPSNGCIHHMMLDTVVTDYVCTVSFLG